MADEDRKEGSLDSPLCDPHNIRYVLIRELNDVELYNLVMPTAKFKKLLRYVLFTRERGKIHITYPGLAYPSLTFS